MDEAQALTALSALANPQRLALVRHLMGGCVRGQAAGDIGAALGMPPSRLSFHLAVLEGAGLIQSQRAGRHVIYAADRAAMGALMHHLLNDCCAGDPGVSACCQGARAVA
jgi:ArsR family transcriptional regulator, arsenate/arsenite/antimonite-responsive transcriptional repressor